MMRLLQATMRATRRCALGAEWWHRATVDKLFFLGIKILNIAALSSALTLARHMQRELGAFMTNEPLRDA